MLFHQIHQGMTQTYMVGNHCLPGLPQARKKNKSFFGSAAALTVRFLPNILVRFGHQLTQAVMHQTARIKCFCNLIQSAPIPSS